MTEKYNVIFQEVENYKEKFNDDLNFKEYKEIQELSELVNKNNDQKPIFTYTSS